MPKANYCLFYFDTDVIIKVELQNFIRINLVYWIWDFVATRISKPQQYIICSLGLWGYVVVFHCQVPKLNF